MFSLIKNCKYEFKKAMNIAAKGMQVFYYITLVL